MTDHQKGSGEIFRRDKSRELICGCEYALTQTPEGPRFEETLGGTSLVQGGFVEIEGTITPNSPMSTTRLREYADKSQTFELELENGLWLDFQFIGSTGNRVRCSNGPRENR